QTASCAGSVSARPPQSVVPLQTTSPFSRPSPPRPARRRSRSWATAACRVSLARSSLPPDVDDVDLTNARRRTNRVAPDELRWVSFRHEIPGHHLGLLSAEHVERLPEIRRARLIARVLHHAVQLPILDLVGQPAVRVVLAIHQWRIGIAVPRLAE